jgi:GTP-binding protein
VEDALLAAGAEAGDEVVIGEGEQAVIFDWEPSMKAGAELLLGRRGHDLRLEGR